MFFDDSLGGTPGLAPQTPGVGAQVPESMPKDLLTARELAGTSRGLWEETPPWAGFVLFCFCLILLLFLRRVFSFFFFFFFFCFVSYLYR